MQSLSGMQLGARHRPGKDPSLFTAPSRILSFSLSLSLSLSLPSLSLYLSLSSLHSAVRSIICTIYVYMYTDFLSRARDIFL